MTTKQIQPKLPSGNYLLHGGRFVRVGDPYTMIRYHGTRHGAGSAIDLFEPRSHSSTMPPPASYFTVDTDLASMYAIRGLSSGGNEAHIYTVDIEPDVIVNLSMCFAPNDKAAMVAATEMGADVIECPEFFGFKRTPETRVLNPNVIKIREVHRIASPNASGDPMPSIPGYEIVQDEREEDDTIGRYLDRLDH